MTLTKTLGTAIAASLCGLAGAQDAPKPPQATQLKLVFDEECSADPHSDKWGFEHGYVDTRDIMLSSRWRENVTQSDGQCRLLQRKEARGNNKAWTSAHLWTKQEFTYGYFEARIKFNAASGVDNAFWLMSASKAKRMPGAAACEIDVVEGAYPDVATTNLHVTDDAGHRADQKHRKLQGGGDFHVYGVRWTQDAIQWYVDGTKVREQSGHPCHAPLAVRLSTAVVKGFMGAVTDKINGTEMQVDYVRVYQ
jgi:beta-glucanase (GH16 family)